jgi:hypothetical protein
VAVFVRAKQLIAALIISVLLPTFAFAGALPSENDPKFKKFKNITGVGGIINASSCPFSQAVADEITAAGFDPDNFLCYAVSGNNVTLTGNTATGSVNTITVNAGALLSLTGVSGTGVAGNLSVTVGDNPVVALSGIQADGSPGTIVVSAAAAMELSSVVGTGAVGNLTVSVSGGSTEVTVYSTAADGIVYFEGLNGSWASIHDGTTGDWIDNTSSSLSIQTEYLVDYSGDVYTDITRGFLYFDTSGIPDGATIDSAVLYLQIAGVPTGSPKLSAQVGTQADTLTTADFDAFSGNTFGQTTTIIATGEKTITLNADGLAAINKTGTTKICIREYDHDYLNSSPASGSGTLAGFYFNEQTGTNLDPKLVITYH